MDDKLTDTMIEWAKDQGLETWLAAHSAVLRNYCKWTAARTEAKVSGEQLTEWAMEALEEFRAELPAPQSPGVPGVDAIEGLLYRNSTDESDDGKWIEAKDYRKVAEAIAHLLANARGGRDGAVAELIRTAKNASTSIQALRFVTTALDKAIVAAGKEG